MQKTKSLHRKLVKATGMIRSTLNDVKSN